MTDSSPSTTTETPFTLPYATHDSDEDSTYIYFSIIKPGTVRRSLVVADGSVLLDLDHDGRILGIEIVNAKQRTPLDLTQHAALLPAPQKGLRIAARYDVSDAPQNGSLIGLTEAQITQILGFKPNHNTDWTFLADGKPCAIRHVAAEFLTFGTRDAFERIFAEQYVADEAHV